MKAIVHNKVGPPKDAFKLEEREIPSIKNDEVLIKVHSFGLNFADVLARKGMYPDAPKPPAILGYDVAGTVSQVGKEVDHVSVNDRVTAMTRFGGYAQYAMTNKFGVHKIPESVSFETATALSTQACTAYYCAIESVSLHAGDRVLVHAAAGGVGSLLVQLAKHKGCIVYGTASSKKLDFLTKLGVDYPIDYTKNDFAKIIENNGHKMDYIFDSIGGKTFKKGFKSLNKGGKIITYGAASQMNKSLLGPFAKFGTAFGFGFFSPIQLLMASNAILGVNMLRIADHKPAVLSHVLKESIQLAASGVLNPKIGKIFTSDQIDEAHSWLEERKSIGKVVVNWNQ